MSFQLLAFLVIHMEPGSESLAWHHPSGSPIASNSQIPVAASNAHPPLETPAKLLFLLLQMPWSGYTQMFQTVFGHQLLIGVFWVYLFLLFKNKIFRSEAMVQWLRVLIALAEDPIQFPASSLGGSLNCNFSSRGSGDLFWTVQGHAPACTKPHLCKHIDT